MNLHDVIVRPLITEKATDLQAQDKYAFQVARTANKVQVKEAVEKGEIDASRHDSYLRILETLPDRYELKREGGVAWQPPLPRRN